MTTYSDRPATATDVEYVWNRLWDRGKEELDRLGLSRASARELAESYLRYESAVLLADDEPIAVVGMCPDGDQWATWFQATEKFADHALAVTGFLREYAETRPVRIYSVMVHPQTEKWFRVLGFERDGWEGKTQSGHPLYRFRKE